MAQTPKDKEDEILDSLDDFDIDTSDFALDELPAKNSDTSDDNSLPETDDDFNLIPEDNDNLDELYIDDDSFSDLSDLDSDDLLSDLDSDLSDSDLDENPENEGEEIFLTPESVSPPDSDDDTDSGEPEDLSLDLDDENLYTDDNSPLTDDNNDDLSLENLLEDDLQLNDDAFADSNADEIPEELDLDEDIDLSGLLDDDDEEFYGVALKEGPQTIIIPQRQLSEDLIDSLIDEDENSDIINFSFPEKNETVSQEDEDYLKLDLTEDQELLANEINADNNLDELPHHTNDNNLLSDDELDKLVLESSNNDNEETETTIEDDEIVVSDKNSSGSKNDAETLDCNEKDYEDDFNGLDLVSLDNETGSLDNETANLTDNNEIDLNLDDDEESIGLSDNELDNILDSTELTEDDSEQIDNVDDDDTLIENNDEIDLDDDNEESIGLSDNELDNILDSTELIEDDSEQIDNVDDDDTLIKNNDEIDLDDDDEESIGLSTHELDNILDNTELIETEMLESIPEEEIDAKIEEVLNDNTSLNLDDEPVGLSLNELDNILDTTELIEAENDDIPAEVEDEINNSDLQPLTSSEEDDAAIYSSLKAEMQAKEAKEAEEKTELLKKDVKTVLSYLDQLLDALPEEKIKEFAESKEFDIYKKLFEELNIKIN